MGEARKKWLVENSQGCTLEGSPTSVAGWKCDTACLAPAFGGFWEVDWETVERVLAGDRNFTAADVRFISWRWYGFGDEVPEKLKHYAKRY